MLTKHSLTFPHQHKETDALLLKRGPKIFNAEKMVGESFIQPLRCLAHPKTVLDVLLPEASVPWGSPGQMIPWLATTPCCLPVTPVEVVVEVAEVVVEVAEVADDEVADDEVVVDRVVMEAVAPRMG